ncbi:MAG: T9SS type A sorting domain-containing protein [Bacteroidota bacterium]
MKKLLLLMVCWTIVSIPTFSQVNILNGTEVRVTGNPYIVINDMNLIQDGNFTSAQSTLVFRGTTNDTITSQNLSLHNLRIDKTGASLVLNDSLRVNSQVEFTSGGLDLGGKLLDLDETGKLLGETENNRAFSSVPNGQIIRKVDFLNAISNADSGNLGLAISSTIPLGETDIVRSHDAQNLPGGVGINRYYEVTPVNNSNLNATVVFNYFDAELNGQSETDLQLFTSTNSGSTWSLLGVNTINTTNNTIQFSGLSSLARLTAATLATFPVEWLDFTAEAISGRASLLSWATGSEQNNRGFMVERTLDVNQDDWEAVGFVDGAGNSTNVSTYEFIDSSPLSGENYYRLRQVDFDGGYDFSEIKSVYFDPLVEVRLYPNPTYDMAYIDFEVPQDQKMNLLMFDGAGKLISNSKYDLLSGRNKISVSVGDLPDGIYYLRLEGQNLNIPLKLKVQ